MGSLVEVINKKIAELCKDPRVAIVSVSSACDVSCGHSHFEALITYSVLKPVLPLNKLVNLITNKTIEYAFPSIPEFVPLFHKYLDSENLSLVQDPDGNLYIHDLAFVENHARDIYVSQEECVSWCSKHIEHWIVNKEKLHISTQALSKIYEEKDIIEKATKKLSCTW